MHRLKRHDEAWKVFEYRLREWEEKTRSLRYNPYTIVCSDPVNRGTASQTHLFLLRNLNRAKDEARTPTRNSGDEALRAAIAKLINNKEQQLTPFGRLTAQKLFELPEPPRVQAPKPPTSLMLEKSEYPLSYSPALDVTKKSRQALLKRYKIQQQKVTDIAQDFLNQKNEALRKYQSLIKSKSEVDVLEALQITNDKYPLPKFLRRSVKYEIDREQKVCVIEFEFPDYRDEKLIVGWSTRGGYINEDRPKFASEGAKKKLIKECLCSLVLRQAHIASLAYDSDLFSHIAINATQTWFDPATGRQQFGIVASLYVPVSSLLEINLPQVDPVACVKHLKGLLTPSPESGGAIRPIFTLDRGDARLVSNRDVAELLSEQTNLASMDWEDFEHLVAQLLEWEFKNKGVEVGVTQASRDRGVDAILFNPDPMLGGKTVIQAKRYTRTVEVAAVRDLYGTVINEGANRGILITTSSFGPDSYEFAKDKPISLVDGQNLLVMLQKHGRNYRIDLVEARNQLGES
jgi:restriction system protein